jgi:Ca2+-binding RTX toxin-like protein
VIFGNTLVGDFPTANFNTTCPLDGSAAGNARNGMAAAGAFVGTVETEPLDGTSGDDWLTGGDGNNLIAGGHGNDVMTGGAGSHTFVFSHGGGADVNSCHDIPDLEPADTSAGGWELR